MNVKTEEFVSMSRCRRKQPRPIECGLGWVSIKTGSERVNTRSFAKESKSKAKIFISNNIAEEINFPRCRLFIGLAW